MNEDPFGFNDLFGARSGFPPPKKKAQKALPWEAKIIDGKYYVPLEQVAELLAINEVLPAVEKGIRVRIQTLKERQEFGLD